MYIINKILHVDFINLKISKVGGHVWLIERLFSEKAGRFVYLSDAPVDSHRPDWNHARLLTLPLDDALTLEKKLNYSILMNFIVT